MPHLKNFKIFKLLNIPQVNNLRIIIVRAYMHTLAVQVEHGDLSYSRELTAMFGSVITEDILYNLIDNTYIIMWF